MNLLVMGSDYAGVCLVKKAAGIYLSRFTCKQADKGKREELTELEKITSTEVFFRVQVREGAVCDFSYSVDGYTFHEAGTPFTAVAGRWTGAKLGFCCSRIANTNDAGWADVDWFRVDR
jgi:hypothetical protein